MKKNLLLTALGIFLSIASFAVGPITGTTWACSGNTRTLADTSAGGVWSSSNLSIATVGSATGVVYAVAGGIATISYTTGTGTATATFTVYTTPSAISGPATLCLGSTITYSNAVTGGIWLSGNTSLATADSVTGAFTGVSTGTLNIYYSNNGCGVFRTITVAASPAPIAGSSIVCAGNTILLTDATSGGVWSSSNSAIATINPTTGNLLGVAAGIATISYSVGSCSATHVVTVTATPGVIGGSSTVCVGSSITLTNATAGGTWLSGNTTIAAADSVSGVVTGIAAGVVNIYYYTASGCATFKSVTVTPTPGAIGGSSSVCLGSSITLTSATSGGSWSSSNTAVATVGATSGVVGSLASGVTTIYYTVGSCSVSKSVTVNATPGSIGGSSSVCVGSSITLTNATSGGSWLSGNTSLATADAVSGVVTGVAPGVVNIYYSIGGCGAFKSITVNPTPSAISGSSSVCLGSSITLSSTTGGGTWLSSNTSVATVGASTGVVGSVAAGSVTIYYTVGGCSVAHLVTVNPLPGAISGSSTVCVGSTISLSNATMGGTWLSGNTSLATVDASTGTVTGVAAGVVNIYYSVGGCGAFKSVTVNATPAFISGSSSICAGYTATLSCSTAGGTWSSSNPSIATVGALSGIVYSVAPGMVTIAYTVGSCSSFTSVTVTSGSGSIMGSSSLCVGSTITLSSSVSGGTWISGNSSLAIVDSLSGVVRGFSPGVLNIYYSTGSCGAFITITVNAVPATISGSATLCVGASSSFTNAVSGGSWLSGNTAIATVSSTGMVHGVAPGVVSIYYAIGSCGTFKSVTVTTCSGSIGGTISTGGSRATSGGVPVVGMLVKLRDWATGTAIAQTYTGAAGQYTFPGLSTGSYLVYPEETGFTTTPSGKITISGTEEIISSINFVLSNSGKTIVPVTTGLPNIGQIQDFTIYPNPSQGLVHIKCLSVFAGDATVTALDMNGRVVARSVITFNTASKEGFINLSDLKNGMYVLTVQTTTGVYSTSITIDQQ